MIQNIKKKYIKFLTEDFCKRNNISIEDKMICYKIVSKINEKSNENLINIPKRYISIKEIKDIYTFLKLNLKKFVVKGNGGCSCKNVMTIIKDKNIYVDKLHRLNYTVDQLIQRIIFILKSTGEVIIEEWIGDNKIPYDYKVYVANGDIKLIRVVDRNMNPKNALFFDKDWNIIKANKIFINNKIRNIENLVDLYRPNKKIRDKFNKILNIIDYQFKSPYSCRYDLYISENKLYFGEATPGCGTMHTYNIHPNILKMIYPGMFKV